ncbi:MAG TPA: hypothetical protein P5541_07655 [Thermovirgaceae bacterium]|jgi:hypothetical protein|nr:hypothetical protein [Thermovirgaceae bacterium]
MERSLLQAAIGAIFMGLGAGFLMYSYADKITGKKKKNIRREEYYDPSKDDRIDNARLVKAISAGFFMGVMFFIYFSNR